MPITILVGWLVLDILQLLVDLKELGNLRKLASELGVVRLITSQLGVKVFFGSMNYGLGKNISLDV